MIDEKKLIEELKEKGKEYDEDCGYWEREGEEGNRLICAGKCVGIVQAIEVVENQQKFCEWIPCSERLPEMHREDMEAEGEYYMISNPVIVTDGQQIYIAEYEADMDYRYGWHSLDGEDYDNIIAWMPLPNPYRTEKESE